MAGPVRCTRTGPAVVADRVLQPISLATSTSANSRVMSP